MIVRNLLFPSMQVGLVREIREDLKHPRSVQFAPVLGVEGGGETGVKSTSIGKWIKGAASYSFSHSPFTDLFLTLWIEFFREICWGRALEDLPDFCEILFLSPLTKFSSLKPLTFDKPSLVVLLGTEIEVQRTNFPHVDLLSSGDVLWVEDLSHRIYLRKFQQLQPSRAPGLGLPDGSSLLLIIKQVGKKE